jgi:hypothetical protein
MNKTLRVLRVGVQFLIVLLMMMEIVFFWTIL